MDLGGRAKDLRAGFLNAGETEDTEIRINGIDEQIDVAARDRVITCDGPIEEQSPDAQPGQSVAFLVQPIDGVIASHCEACVAYLANVDHLRTPEIGFTPPTKTAFSPRPCLSRT